MERNTGKFMKELWALLLSAQNNASGVPQLFLEAKEEEMRKKKVFLADFFLLPCGLPLVSSLFSSFFLG